MKTLPSAIFSKTPRWLGVVLSLSVGLGTVLILVGGVGGFTSTAVALAAPHANLSVNTTDDELNSDGDCSLREAIQSANTDSPVDACTTGSGADTILVPAGTYTLTLAGAGEDANATGDLDITSSLTLQGAGAATTILSASGLDRAVHATADLTLTGLTLRDGNVTGGHGGGLAQFGGVLTLSDTVFFSNTTTLNGGGLYAITSTVFITASRFITNTATGGSPEGLGGGAALITTTGELWNSDFLTNTAATSGGGLYVTDPLTVTGGLFQSNRAVLLSGAAGGGGLRANSTLNLIDTQFLTNTTSGNGGGVRVGGSGVFTNTTFRGNSATFTCGGACVDGATTLLVGGLFQSNSSSSNAGGLGAGTLTMWDTQFLSNTTPGIGGGVRAGSASLNGGLFLGNSSTSNSGGGLYVFTTLTLTDTQFISNTASGASVTGGGARVDGAAILNGGLFQNNRCNTAGCNGGGLFANATLGVTGTQFISNTTVSNGGGVRAQGAVTVTNGLFQNNRANASAGGGLNAQTTVVLSNTSFISNTAGGSGGGAFVVMGVTLWGGVFQENSSVTGFGGGLHMNGALAMTDTLFISNTAALAGGGANVSGATTLTGGLFQNNQSLTQGGGLGTSSPLTATGTHFISNTAVSSGGGAFVNGVATLTGALFQNNASTGSAGGGLQGNNVLILTDTQFISNTSSADGGGARGSSATLIGGLFQNNRCTTAVCSGGGLQLSNALTFTDTQFHNNLAGQGGGGAFVSGVSTLNGGLFQLNACSAAGCQGGGLRANNGGTLTGTQFLSNTAAGGGGGALASAPLTVTSSVFQDNTCLDVGCQGGGLRIGNTLTLTGTRFLGNTADLGGGLYHNFGPGRVVNALFARNTATTTLGAALFVTNTTGLDVWHTTIASPAVAGGSAVFVNAGTVRLTDTVILSHTIGISTTGGTVSEDYNYFFGNGQDTAGGVASGSNHPAGAPLFIDPAGDDYHLLPGNPAVDTGLDIGVTIDFDNEPRPQGGFDIGYDEFVGDTPISGLSAINSSPALVGAAVSFTATITAGTNVTYQWNFGDGTSSVGSGATTTHTYTASGLYPAVVTATNNLGSVSASTPVTITDAPISSLGAVNDSPTPLGNATQFTATVTGGTLPITYTWNFGDGNAGNGATTTHTYAAVGNYTAVVTATNSAGSVSTSTPVTITEVPITGLNASNNSPTQLGSATTFTASISAGSNVTYQWNFGDGSFGNGTTAAHTYAAVGNYMAIVTATNSLGSVGASTPVTITPAPSPTFTLYWPLFMRQSGAPFTVAPADRPQSTNANSLGIDERGLAWRSRPLEVDWV